MATKPPSADLLELKRKRAQQLADRKRRVNQRIFHQKIDKRKHYGLGVEIKKYQEIFDEAFNIDIIEDAIFNVVGREKIIGSIVGAVLSLVSADDFFTPAISMKLGEVISSSVQKGSKRVFNVSGEQVVIPTEELDIQPLVRNLIAQQSTHYKNYSERMLKKVEENLTKSIEEGESIAEATKNLRKDLTHMKKWEGERLSRSEIIHASAEGTKETMRVAGIENVIWYATIDDRTCEICKNLHKKKFELGEVTPVEDTHPNCRCVLLADV